MSAATTSDWVDATFTFLLDCLNRGDWNPANLAAVSPVQLVIHAEHLSPVPLSADLRTAFAEPVKRHGIGVVYSREDEQIIAWRYN
jgi:hypothetical protein